MFINFIFYIERMRHLALKIIKLIYALCFSDKSVLSKKKLLGKTNNH